MISSKMVVKKIAKKPFENFSKYKNWQILFDLPRNGMDFRPGESD